MIRPSDHRIRKDHAGDRATRRHTTRRSSSGSGWPAAKPRHTGARRATAASISGRGREKGSRSRDSKAPSTPKRGSRDEDDAHGARSRGERGARRRRQPAPQHQAAGRHRRRPAGSSRVIAEPAPAALAPSTSRTRRDDGVDVAEQVCGRELLDERRAQVLRARAGSAAGPARRPRAPTPRAARPRRSCSSTRA